MSSRRTVGRRVYRMGVEKGVEEGGKEGDMAKICVDRRRSGDLTRGYMI